jgi:hypothetical protein
MPENMIKLKLVIEQEFPNFTGRIVFDLYQGEVGSTEKIEKKRYALKNKIHKEAP